MSFMHSLYNHHLQIFRVFLSSQDGKFGFIFCFDSLWENPKHIPESLVTCAPFGPMEKMLFAPCSLNQCLTGLDQTLAACWFNEPKHGFTVCENVLLSGILWFPQPGLVVLMKETEFWQKRLFTSYPIFKRAHGIIGIMQISMHHIGSWNWSLTDLLTGSSAHRSFPISWVGWYSSASISLPPSFPVLIFLSISICLSLPNLPPPLPLSIFSPLFSPPS